MHLTDPTHLACLLAAAADPASGWHAMWKEILVPDVSWVEKIIRPILVYFFMIIGLRVAGKRELAQLNPFDLIVLLTLSNTVQNAIIGNDNSVSGGFIGASTLLAVNYLVVRTVRRSKRLQRLLEGRSDVLVWRGKIQGQNLEKELMSKADLTAAAHKQGIASLKDVERCVLEPTGTITFIEKKPGHDVERHDQLVGLLAQIRQDLTLLQAERQAERAAAGNGSNGGGADHPAPADGAALRGVEQATRAAERLVEGGADGAAVGRKPVSNASESADGDHAGPGRG